MAGGPDTVRNLKPRFGGAFSWPDLDLRAPGSTPATGFEYLVNALRQGLNDVGFVVMISRRLKSPPGPKPVASGPELVRDGGAT